MITAPVMKEISLVIDLSVLRGAAPLSFDVNICSEILLTKNLYHIETRSTDWFLYDTSF